MPRKIRSCDYLPENYQEFLKKTALIKWWVDGSSTKIPENVMEQQCLWLAFDFLRL